MRVFCVASIVPASLSYKSCTSWTMTKYARNEKEKKKKTNRHALAAFTQKRPVVHALLHLWLHHCVQWYVSIFCFSSSESKARARGYLSFPSFVSALEQSQRERSMCDQLKSTGKAQFPSLNAIAGSRNECQVRVLVRQRYVL